MFLKTEVAHVHVCVLRGLSVGFLYSYKKLKLKSLFWRVIRKETKQKEKNKQNSNNKSITEFITSCPKRSRKKCKESIQESISSLMKN